MLVLLSHSSIVELAHKHSNCRSYSTSFVQIFSALDHRTVSLCRRENSFHRHCEFMARGSGEKNASVLLVSLVATTTTAQHGSRQLARTIHSMMHCSALQNLPKMIHKWQFGVNVVRYSGMQTVFHCGCSSLLAWYKGVYIQLKLISWPDIVVGISALQNYSGKSSFWPICIWKDSSNSFRMIKFSVFLITSTVFVAHSAEVQQDSYLDALQRSKDAETINGEQKAKVYHQWSCDKLWMCFFFYWICGWAFLFIPIQDSRVARDDYSSGYSDNSVGLTSGYDYSPPKPNYGPPSSEYGTGFSSSAPYPPSSYGHPVYGPPKPINMYNYAGPPHAYNLPDEHWLLDKLKFKLDLFTIGKLLIKLIIFKKIVKFIALICLLLWLPKFQSKHMKMDELEDAEDDEDDDEEDDRRRQFGYCK